MDTEEKPLATTMNNSEEYSAVLAFVDSPTDSQVLQGVQFFGFDENQLEFVILAKGDSDDVYMVGKIASFNIQTLLVAYKERYDKDNIKNLLLDNLLLVDIYNRQRNSIDTDSKRVVFLIETKEWKGY